MIFMSVRGLLGSAGQANYGRQGGLSDWPVTARELASRGITVNAWRPDRSTRT